MRIRLPPTGVARSHAVILFLYCAKKPVHRKVVQSILSNILGINQNQLSGIISYLIRSGYIDVDKNSMLSLSNNGKEYASLILSVYSSLAKSDENISSTIDMICNQARKISSD